MRVFALVAAALVLLASGCGGEAQPDHQSEWRDVLRHKKKAMAADATPDHKQVYADSVQAFVRKHPKHGRAREVWARLQLEFADDLAAAGRYQDAIRFYRSVLTEHPENEHARRGLAIAADRLAVGREKLARLTKGMSKREVLAILGEPLPGWTAETRRADAEFEAWYYRTSSGGVAGVYFREGKVIAAEENSESQLGRLGS
jgi:Flp pilus assembly protein TadD